VKKEVERGTAGNCKEVDDWEMTIEGSGIGAELGARVEGEEVERWVGLILMSFFAR